MSKLAAAVKALSASLAEACPTAQVQSLTSDSSGTVTIKAQDAEERQVVINLCFLDPDEYPRSGLLVQVDEDASKVPSSVVSRLAATSERFQDGANLGAVLVKVRTLCMLRWAETQRAAAVERPSMRSCVHAARISTSKDISPNIQHSTRRCLRTCLLLYSCRAPCRCVVCWRSLWRRVC